MLGGNIGLFCCCKEVQSCAEGYIQKLSSQRGRLCQLLDCWLSASNPPFLFLLLIMEHFSFASLHNVKIAEGTAGTLESVFLPGTSVFSACSCIVKMDRSSQGIKGVLHQQVSSALPLCAASPITQEGSFALSSNTAANFSTGQWSVITQSPRGTNSKPLKEEGLHWVPCLSPRGSRLLLISAVSVNLTLLLVCYLLCR